MGPIRQAWVENTTINMQQAHSICNTKKIQYAKEGSCVFRVNYMETAFSALIFFVDPQLSLPGESTENQAASPN